MGYQSSFAELPRGVGSVSPQHKPLDDGFADFFDYSRYYDLPQHDMEEVASSSGRSSLPDLTSASSPAPSDNGSSSSSSSRGGPPSSPSLAPDGLWDRLNEVREHDDHLTIPKQTLYTQAPHHYPAILPAQHPFGGAPSDAYYHQATLATDFYLSPDSPDASSSSSFSPSSSSTTSSSSSPKQPRTGRGRRTKPLHNKDEVAEVRAMGACLHCRISKTRCNDQACCDKCTKNAVKHCFGDIMDLMCIRCLPSKNRGVFGTIADGQARTVTGASARREMGARSRPVVWNVFFGSGSSYLPLSVLHRPAYLDGALDVDMSSGEAVCYVLDRDAVPSPRDLMAWSSAHLLKDGVNDFQSAVDELLHSYATSRSRFAYHELTRKVYDLRCMYNLFKSQDFWYSAPQIYGAQLQPLPISVANELRQMAVSAMKSLEMDVLRLLDKALSPLGKCDPWTEKLPLWTSLMECILLYRDLWMSDVLSMAQQWSFFSKGDRIHSSISNLLGTFLVMHDAHFGKEWRSSSPFQCSQAEAHQFSLQFLQIMAYRDSFYLELSQAHIMPDVLLYALFVDPRRANGSQGRRKRVKH